MPFLNSFKMQNKVYHHVEMISSNNWQILLLAKKKHPANSTFPQCPYISTTFDEIAERGYHHLCNITHTERTHTHTYNHTCTEFSRDVHLVFLSRSQTQDQNTLRTSLYNPLHSKERGVENRAKSEHKI